MAIGKKVKKKSNSTIEAVRRVAQNPENARNVKGISTQRNSYRVSAEKKSVGGKLRDNGMAQASWGSKIRAPKASDNGNAIQERGRWFSAKAAKAKSETPFYTKNHGLHKHYTAYQYDRSAGTKAKRETNFRTMEQTRRNAVENTKIGSVGAKNKTRSVQNISDFPVTFVNDARSRADNLSRGVVDSYKKREKKRKK